MNEDKRKSLARETLSRYIADRHMRCTTERQAVLDRIMEMPARFTVDELCAAVGSGGFRVSRATVYKSVSLFSRAGLLRRLHLQPDTWETTIEPSQSVRLICRKCGKVRDVSDRQLARTLALKRYQSFLPDSFEVCMTGYCTGCRPKDKNRKK